MRTIQEAAWEYWYYGCPVVADGDKQQVYVLDDESDTWPTIFFTWEGDYVC